MDAVKARILIVEDEQIIAADLAGKLRRIGHEVIGTAISGREAIELAEKLRPNLVLMDVRLDGSMSGTEAARTIQAQTGAQVIYITAYPGVFIRDPEQMTEPRICLTKPFSLVQLEAALQATVGHVPRRSDIH